MKLSIKYQNSFFSLLVALLALPALGAELSYSDLPMPVVTSVQSNVALMLDNSGSMTATDTGGTGNITSACDGVTVKTLPLTRLDALKQAACQIVTDNASAMRIGLYRFTGTTNGTGFQLVNFGGSSASLRTSIQGILADQQSILSSGLKIIINDYVGASSPIQYRCQKNYTIFVSDGLPTRTQDVTSVLALPTLTPAQSSPWINNNTTTSPGWDGFLDPVISAATPYYSWFDDFSQFAYDVDMKTNVSTTSPTTCSGVATPIGKDCSVKVGMAPMIAICVLHNRMW